MSMWRSYIRKLIQAIEKRIQDDSFEKKQNVDSENKQQDKTDHLSRLSYDLLLKIASSLSLVDVFALRSCSRSFREFSSLDSLWASLFKQRWPHMYAQLSDDESNGFNPPQELTWKEFYIKRHRKLASVVSRVTASVNKKMADCLVRSLRLLDILTPDEQLTFEDVEIFFFRRAKVRNVLVFIGYNYSAMQLKVPVQQIEETVQRCGHLGRRVPKEEFTVKCLSERRIQYFQSVVSETTYH